MVRVGKGSNKLILTKITEKSIEVLNKKCCVHLIKNKIIKIEKEN